jgi:hypothetical protein
MEIEDLIPTKLCIHKLAIKSSITGIFLALTFLDNSLRDNVEKY